MENRKRISIYDYPEHLNPFSDRYMSPFAPRYLHKNKTWSSKLSKKLNRFTADENGRNDRDNLSAGNQENGTTSADKRTVPNGDCPSPLREPVHMERESEHKSSTTVRNQNNHVRPPIRRRKKKAPLPPNITDDSISLAGDSANESLVQENNSFEIGAHVEEKREPEEKSDKRVINDTNQIYVEKCEVTTISEVNNNRIVSSTTVIVNKQEEPSNDDKLSEDRTQSSDNVAAAVAKDVRSEDVEKLLETNHDVAAIIVDNDKVNHENKLSRERIYDDESTCEAAEGIKNEIVHQNDVTLTYDDDKVDLFSAEPTSSSSSSVETENADKQEMANAQQQTTTDGEEENINHDETKKKDESEKPDHHHVEKTENLQEDLPEKITTTLLLLHNKTEGGENLKTTNDRSRVLTNDSNNSKLDNHHASTDSNSHDNISTGIESKESESRVNDDASRLVNNNIVISVN